MLWYPLKHRSAVSRFSEDLAGSGLRRILQLHLLVGDDATATGPLAGAGLILVNPPYTLKREAEQLLPWFADRLGRNGSGRWSSHWLAGE